MARNAGVWGIDIGRCALKAMRCRLDGDVVVADSFDYIEYPKLLTQQDADAAQLVKEALQQFLSRNNLRGDKVAISVPGESGLARYFKPPPVDVKKIADIVKYEARQQIPFALEDVIWDYQRMPGGQEVDGFALESEVGLFAMKREQVAKALKPFLEAEIEVDFIQLAPIAIYNFVAHDMTNPLPEGEDYNADSPPPSMVVLSIGTETTDLVVTNGYRLWQRNIPLGGNHFTKQLSKDLKLTFAKAEHLKRNPRQAEDPKAIFQAMRPVFGDMVTEIQRSIGFFHSLDRKAKITNIVTLGNTVKLPGLTQYLSKHLGYEITELDAYRRLTGATVVTSPAFKENLLAFGGCYGLCVQGLAKSKLKTNLLPRELITERLIKAKKPWAVAAVSLLVLACALNFIFHYFRWEEVHDEHAVNGVAWKDALSNVTQASSVSQNHTKLDEEHLKQQTTMEAIGKEVVGAADRRVLWLEVMKSINESLPEMADAKRIPKGTIPDHRQLPFAQRRDLKIEYVESQHYPDLTVWYNTEVKRLYEEQHPEVLAALKAAAPAAAPGTTPPPPAPPPAPPPQPVVPGTPAPATGPTVPGPTGPGWVFELKGYHFFMADATLGGSAHVKNTLLRSLEHGTVDLPMGPNGQIIPFKLKELGIGYSILVRERINRGTQLPNPNYAGPTNGTGTGTGLDAGPTATPADPNNPAFFTVDRCDFVVQFCWQEKPLNIRLEERVKAQKEEAAKAAAGIQNPALQNPQVPAVPGAPVPGPAAPVAPVPAPGPAVPAPGPAVPGPAAAVPPGPAVPAPMPMPVVDPAAVVPAPAPVVPPGPAPVPAPAP